MQVTENIHALKIPFKVPISPDKIVDRYAYSYIVFGDKITLIDTGVKDAETIIFDYIRNHERDPEEISMIILSHSHPDHIGSAKSIKSETRCKVLAHMGEKDWIEDTEKQFRERPVPGFNTLVDGPVTVDQVLADGEILDLGHNIRCEVMNTPGHSRGSVSLLFKNDKILFTADSLPVPNDMPIYDDIVASVNSLKLLKKVQNIEILLSSWEDPIYGYEQIEKRIDDGFLYLLRIHEAILKVRDPGNEDLMNLCRFVMTEMGLPLFMANPLVARSFASNLAALKKHDLFE
jgi:hydroxyacylglutathione hydrolase